MPRGVIESRGVTGSAGVTGSDWVTGKGEAMGARVISSRVTLFNGVEVVLTATGRVSWASDWTRVWAAEDLRHVNLGSSTYGHVDYYYVGVQR